MTERAHRYVLNTNPGEQDVLHRDPVEECNTDDVKGRQLVDPATAEALLTQGSARKCQHCWRGGPA